MILPAILLAAATPAPPPLMATQAAAPQAPAIDPERRAAAARLVDLIFPEGALQKVWGGVGDASAFGMDAVFGMKVGDGNKTLGEIAEQADPHFRERSRIEEQVMMEEVGRLFGQFEPDFRRAMTDIYATRFTARELQETAAFYATPAGRRFALESLTMMHAPELRDMMAKVANDMMGSMPKILKRMEEATAHLPPPPKPASE